MILWNAAHANITATATCTSRSDHCFARGRSNSGRPRQRRITASSDHTSPEWLPRNAHCARNTTLYWCDQVVPIANDSDASASAETKLAAVAVRVRNPSNIALDEIHANTHSAWTTTWGGGVWPSSIHRPTGLYKVCAPGTSPVETSLSSRASVRRIALAIAMRTIAEA